MGAAQSLLQPRLVTIVAVVVALWWARPFFIPLTISVLISYALEPMVLRLETWRIPRGVAVPIVMLAVLAFVIGGAYALRSQAVAFADRLPEGARAAGQALRGRQPSAGPLAKLQEAAKELEAATASPPERPADGVTAVRIEESTFKWNEWIRQGSYSAITIAVQTFAVVCLVYYMLMAGDLFRRKMVRLVGPSLADKRLTVEILGEIDRQIERFLLARAIISAVVGVAVWASFLALGIDQAGIWGVLAGLLFTIPVVGPAIVIVGAGLAGAMQGPSLSLALAAAGACTVIAALEGNVLQPWLMSRVGEMNAVAVFVSLLFWGWLWGPWGFLLAVPITAAIKAVCDRVESLNPYAELLKG